MREIPEHSILIGDEITTAMLVELPLERIAGIVTVLGAANSLLALVLDRRRGCRQKPRDPVGDGESLGAAATLEHETGTAAGSR